MGWIGTPCLNPTSFRSLEEMRDGRTEGPTDRPTKPLVELLCATKNMHYNFNALLVDCIFNPFGQFVLFILFQFALFSILVHLSGFIVSLPPFLLLSLHLLL